MYSGVLVFTGFRRAAYWENYVPKVYIYEDKNDLQKVLPRVMDRQKTLIKKGIKEPFGLILDTEFYEHQTLNIPDDLLIEVVFTDNFDFLKPVNPTYVEFGKKFAAK